MVKVALIRFRTFTINKTDYFVFRNKPILTIVGLQGDHSVMVVV